MARTDSGWIGGANYISNLLQSVAALPDRTIETIMFTPPMEDASLVARFGVDEHIQTPLVSPRDPRRLAGKVAQRCFGHDVVFEHLAKRHRIDVVSHSLPLGRRSSVPVVSWIPDFQEEHLPEFFTAEERARRARNNLASAAAARVIVSSAHALRDLERCLPQAAHKADVLRFVAGFGSSSMAPSVEEIATRYALDGPFFYLPNQFWIHKNHRVVIDALARLKTRGVRVTVIASGHTSDYRHATHFDGLMELARSLDVLDCFRVVGLIPYPDVAALMKHCVAVINPSLFEGWSTTVEESKSLGKRVLLSDIAVHREQASDRASYFGADDPDALATLLERALQQYNPESERIAADHAALALPKRVADFARAFEAIVRGAVA